MLTPSPRPDNMPDYSLVAASNRYAISPTILKNGLLSVIRGGKLSDLSSPVFFPDTPVLQQLFDQLYRWIYAMDDNAAQILKDNASRILKSILLANPEKMAGPIDLDRGNEYDGWGKESSELIRQGKCFDIYEGQFINDDGRVCEGVTTIKMDCDGDTVIFAQGENQISPHEERCRCVLRLPLCQLKKACLRAYIQAEHEALNIADLSDLDLSEIDIVDVEFSHTRINASFLPNLTGRNRGANLLGTQLCGRADLSMVCLSQFVIDHPLALQLIKNGADRRQVIERYLDSERSRRHVNPDLSGFDLRELDLGGLDLRQVNFRHASRRQMPSLPGKLPGVLFDDNLFEATLDASFRDLLWCERAESIVLTKLPADLRAPEESSAFTLTQFKAFAAALDKLHQQKKVLRNLQPANLRIFNDRIYFVDQHSVAVAGELDESTPVPHTFGVPILRMENAIRMARLNGCADAESYHYRHDQYCFFTTLLQAFHVIPNIERLDFSEAVAHFIDTLKCSKDLKTELYTFLLDPLSTGLSATLPAYLADLASI